MTDRLLASLHETQSEIVSHFKRQDFRKKQLDTEVRHTRSKLVRQLIETKKRNSNESDAELLDKLRMKALRRRHIREHAEQMRKKTKPLSHVSALGADRRKTLLYGYDGAKEKRDEMDRLSRKLKRQLLDSQAMEAPVSALAGRPPLRQLPNQQDEALGMTMGSALATFSLLDSTTPGTAGNFSAEAIGTEISSIPSVDMAMVMAFGVRPPRDFLHVRDSPRALVMIKAKNLWRRLAIGIRAAAVFMSVARDRRRRKRFAHHTTRHFDESVHSQAVRAFAAGGIPPLHFVSEVPPPLQIPVQHSFLQERHPPRIARHEDPEEVRLRERGRVLSSDMHYHTTGVELRDPSVPIFGAGKGSEALEAQTMLLDSRPSLGSTVRKPGLEGLVSTARSIRSQSQSPRSSRTEGGVLKSQSARSTGSQGRRGLGHRDRAHALGTVEGPLDEDTLSLRSGNVSPRPIAARTASAAAGPDHDFASAEAVRIASLDLSLDNVTGSPREIAEALLAWDEGKRSLSRSVTGVPGDLHSHSERNVTRIVSRAGGVGGKSPRPFPTRTGAAVGTKVGVGTSTRPVTADPRSRAPGTKSGEFSDGPLSGRSSSSSRDISESRTVRSSRPPSAPLPNTAGGSRGLGGSGRIDDTKPELGPRSARARSAANTPRRHTDANCSTHSETETPQNLFLHGERPAERQTAGQSKTAGSGPQKRPFSAAAISTFRVSHKTEVPLDTAGTAEDSPEINRLADHAAVAAKNAIERTRPPRPTSSSSVPARPQSARREADVPVVALALDACAPAPTQVDSGRWAPNRASRRESQ
eukprot:Rmarinus@m.12868